MLLSLFPRRSTWYHLSKRVRCHPHTPKRSNYTQECLCTIVNLQFLRCKTISEVREAILPASPKLEIFPPDIVKHLLPVILTTRVHGCNSPFFGVDAFGLVPATAALTSPCSLWQKRLNVLVEVVDGSWKRANRCDALYL